MKELFNQEKMINRLFYAILVYATGIFGIHKFIKGKKGMGIVYLFTCGLFVIGWIVDSILAIVNIFKPLNYFNYCENKISSEKLHKGLTYEFNHSNHSSKVKYDNIILVPKEIYSDTYMKRKAKELPSSYIVFDTETTGLDPAIDKIIELSAIKYVNHQKVDTFSYLVNPRLPLDPIITKITGITNSDLINKPTIKEVLPEFIEWINGFVLVAHNAPYDVKMIACECYRNDIPMFENKVIDTLTLSKRMFTEDDIPNYKLESIKDYLGLTNQSHRALDDCETCSAIYQLYFDNHN